MYKPLPKELTIKKSPIEGLGLYAIESIKKNTYIGVTHIRDEQFENKYIRTPVGGFYNHSNDPNVIRMVSDTLPKLKFGDIVDTKKNIFFGYVSTDQKMNGGDIEIEVEKTKYKAAIEEKPLHDPDNIIIKN